MGGQYQRLINYLSDKEFGTHVQLPNYNNNYYLSCDDTSNYNSYTNGSIITNNMLPDHSHNINCRINDIAVKMETPYSFAFQTVVKAVYNAYNIVHKSYNDTTTPTTIGGAIVKHYRGDNPCLSINTNSHSHNLSFANIQGNLYLGNMNTNITYAYDSVQYQSIGSISNANVQINPSAKHFVSRARRYNCEFKSKQTYHNTRSYGVLY